MPPTVDCEYVCNPAHFMEPSCKLWCPGYKFTTTSSTPTNSSPDYGHELETPIQINLILGVATLLIAILLVSVYVCNKNKINAFLKKFRDRIPLKRPIQEQTPGEDQSSAVQNLPISVETEEDRTSNVRDNLTPGDHNSTGRDRPATGEDHHSTGIDHPAREDVPNHQCDINAPRRHSVITDSVEQDETSVLLNDHDQPQLNAVLNQSNIEPYSSQSNLGIPNPAGYIALFSKREENINMRTLRGRGEGNQNEFTYPTTTVV